MHLIVFGQVILLENHTKLEQGLNKLIWQIDDRQFDKIAYTCNLNLYFLSFHIHSVSFLRKNELQWKLCHVSTLDMLYRCSYPYLPMQLYLHISYHSNNGCSFASGHSPARGCSFENGVALLKMGTFCTSQVRNLCQCSWKIYYQEPVRVGKWAWRSDTQSMVIDILMHHDS